MIPKKQRLPAQLLLGRKYGVVRTPYFSLKTTLNNLPFSRFAVVIGRAAIKSAVRRNFWRRQAAEVFSSVFGKPKDVIVIFNAGIKDLTKATFKKEFQKHLLS